VDLREIINKKRKGLCLSAKDIRYWIKGVVGGEFTDYQNSALLMAICIQGLSMTETVELTRSMAYFGSPLQAPKKAPRIGKHSTGGVGDKATFLIGPLVSSYGVQVPFMSGRGLGHTGGTIDKLAGIPGLKTSLSTTRIIKILKDQGFCIFEQSPQLAPADQKIYALRDATGTVESIPLIVSSILSKKLQEGLNGLLLDVKYGVGSLMGPLIRAKKLAQALLEVAGDLNLRAVAVISSMDEPLGQAVGNNLEIRECLDALNGQGPPDLVQLVVGLSHEMLKMALPRNRLPRPQDLRHRLTQGGLEKTFLGGLRAQGGKARDILQLPVGARLRRITATRSGFIREVNARVLGQVAMALGAGRNKIGESIDPAVGLKVFKKIGDKVKRGEPLAEIYFNKGNNLVKLCGLLKDAIKIGSVRVRPRRLMAAVLKNY